MRLQIINSVTIPDGNGYYKIGGDVHLDTSTDVLQIERMAQVFGIPLEQLYLAPGQFDPFALELLSRKYLQYIVEQDLQQRR